MNPVFATIAGERGILRLSGPDTRTFLQGILSNDVDKASPAQAIWSAFLTPQGKYLHDFFIVEQEGALLLEVERERAADLARRLRPYKLRSKVEIEDVSSDFAVALIWGDGVADELQLAQQPGAARSFGEGGLVYLDPRLPEVGARALLPADIAEQSLRDAGFQAGDRADYERRRISLGLPDGARDMEVEKAILLENGFDELGGVDWNKGCYLGQELTARTKYRGLVKKRLVPVRLEGPTPEPGSAVTSGERTVGEIRSAAGDMALALLRLEALEAPLQSGETGLTVARPGWLRLQQEEQANNPRPA